MPEDLLPSTVPEYRIAMHCFSDPHQREKLRQALRDVIEEVGRTFDLSALDGVTVTHNYREALTGLYEWAPEEAPRWFQRWGDPDASVSRLGPHQQQRSHIIFLANRIDGLGLGQDSTAYQTAFHTVAHECAHVAVNAEERWRLLAPLPFATPKSGREVVMELSWHEYAACALSAGMGASDPHRYEGNFLQDITRAEDRMREALLQYEEDAQAEALFASAVDAVGSLMITSSYHLGNVAGLELEVERDLPRTWAALQGHWFRPSFQLMEVALPRLLATYWDEGAQWDPEPYLGTALASAVQRWGITEREHPDGTGVYWTAPEVAQVPALAA